MNRHLFLFGGGPPFSLKFAERFVHLVKEKEGPVSILCLEREGWKDYMPKYTQALEEYGFADFRYIPLPTTPVRDVIHCLSESAGIIIGGGDTNRYADYIVDSPISDTIRNLYKHGVPVAGFSAGALISPKLCVISPKDNIQKEFQERKGLGLIDNVLIAVHFSEWADEDHLQNAASKLSGYDFYGIDEKNGMYCLNEHIKELDGNGVYRLDGKEIKNIANSNI
ncbi:MULTISPECIES: Type 1 glutamine amidotransferase-like domain-containing protein [Bacillus]|uniref:Type 1 glutamine amidotransferase-like domain-containing protein n=1 Tax=Bacillus TaxID=1386 RepID=UPI000BB8182E|nr:MULTISPECIES: Type 1 glutamine amidotransferase-like domain-containing protein [Bacillus]